MKNAIKHFALLLTIGLVIGTSGCKKDDLLGTYYCAMHNIAVVPPSYLPKDTIIGYATINVYRSGTNIVISNETLNLASGFNGSVKYTSPTASTNSQMLYYDNAVFVNNFDSMIYSYNYTEQGVGSETNSSYQGHKIN